MSMRLVHTEDLSDVNRLSDYVMMVAKEKNRKLSLGIMQMYSMRSYTMSTYNLLLDGNLNATLHMLWQCREFIEKVHITMPKDVELKQLIKLREFFDTTFRFAVTIGSDDYCQYGINAMQSREQAGTRFDVNSMIESLGLDLCICDFEKTVYSLNIQNIDKVVYRFNVSYSKKFNPSEHLREMAIHQNRILSYGFPVFILNESQMSYDLLGTKELNPNLVLQRQWFSMQFMIDHQMPFFCGSDSRINSQLTKEFDFINEKAKKNGVRKIAFHPFRLSDPEYQAATVISKFLHEGYLVIVSDNNDSADRILSKEIVNHQNFHELTCDETAKKSFMYHLFDGALRDYDVVIPYSQKIEHIAHQMFIEMYCAQVSKGHVQLVGRIMEDAELLNDVLELYLGA